ALDMEILRQQSDKGRRKLPDSVKTDSIGKMNNLKLLQLNQLELTGSYENILKDLRWLCWRQSHLKTIPQKLHMEKLVVIDMSRSKLKVLPLLKILNLTDSDDLVEIQNISRLPNLEFLVLVHCRKLVSYYHALQKLIGDYRKLLRAYQDLEVAWLEMRPLPEQKFVSPSYWPIGESLHDGDEVDVAIVVTKGNLVIQRCGASLVYTDEEDEIQSFEDSNKSIVDVNESFEDNNESFKEKNAHADILGADILGADISGFKLSNGTCYLCRRDYSQLMEVGRLNPNWFRNLVGDTIDYTEIGGWRKTGRPDKPYQSFTELKNIRCTIYGPRLLNNNQNEFYTIEELTESSIVNKAVKFPSEFSGKKKVVLKVELSGDIEKQKVMKAASSITGVDSISVDMKEGKLTLTGDVDPLTIVSRLRKLVTTTMLSVGLVLQKEDKRKLLSADKYISNVSADLNLSENIIRSSRATYNPSAFPKPSNGYAFSAMIILSETGTLGKSTVQRLAVKQPISQQQSASSSRSASIHHHIMQTSDDHGVVHGVYAVVEGDGQLVEEGGGQLEVEGGAPLVVVEGGEPRGLQVVEGGGGRLVVGGEDGGGEVVILASLKCFFSC
ncbi:Toll/interleukin-1 receptor domain-containing protein, partial [Tanacetum coccineum]